MTHFPRLYLLCAFLFVISVSSSTKADSVTFTYTIVGNANATQNGALLQYSFVPLQSASTFLGPLDARYQGVIDFARTPPSGPTTTIWLFPNLGQFTGSGLEIVGAPDANGIALFSGTSIINGGTGLFAGATGSTTYTGSFNVVTGVATFKETVTISGPGLSAAVPEPSTLLLMGTGLAGIARGLRRTRIRGRDS